MDNHEARVVIIGGGLAGMTVAKELAKHGVRATILEQGKRLGGKAGADEVDVHHQDGTTEKMLIDHGYHVFPAWYLNVRALLRELGIEGHLIDIDFFHHLHRPTNCGSGNGNLGRLYGYSGVSSVGGLLRGIFSGEIPRPQSLLAAYFFLDLMAQRLGRVDHLDYVSVTGLLHSRFYRSESLARFHNENVLQASSIPAHDLSAMTLQNVAKAFLAKRKPFFSILDGNMQTTFIDKFGDYLCRLGVCVRLQEEVKGFDLDGNRVRSVRLASGRGEGSPDDLFVLATPPKVASKFVDGSFYTIEQRALAAQADGAHGDVCSLSGLHHLDSEPMAAFHLWLRPRLTELPPEPVVLYGSRFRTSFVDISRHWASLASRDMTVLSVIASDYKELQHLDQTTRVEQVVAEILEYVPAARHCWRHVDERAHINEPLFLNTVGSWTYRPQARTALPNLFVAGDYCRSEADLTTMESAVSSGVSTASAILSALGKPAPEVRPQSLRRAPWWALKACKWALFPVVAPIGAYNWIQREIGAWRK